MTKPEPRVTFCTVRDCTDPDDPENSEFHIECRFDDGQKLAAVTVDEDFSGLAHRIADLLNMESWQPIETAPDYERVWVAGWQPRHGNVQGYWWRHDDVCDRGIAIEHPTATHWCPHNVPAYPPRPSNT